MSARNLDVIFDSDLSLDRKVTEVFNHVLSTEDGVFSLPVSEDILISVFQHPLVDVIVINCIRFYYKLHKILSLVHFYWVLVRFGSDFQILLESISCTMSRSSASDPQAGFCWLSLHPESRLNLIRPQALKSPIAPKLLAWRSEACRISSISKPTSKNLFF